MLRPGNVIVASAPALTTGAAFCLTVIATSSLVDSAPSDCGQPKDVTSPSPRS
jgi:hypothetical protein